MDTISLTSKQKDTAYIPIVDECCVICMETLDNKNRKCVPHSTLFTTSCDCKYRIHKKCFAEWLKQRPTNDIRCLICASDGMLLLTRMELCRRKIPFCIHIFYKTCLGCYYIFFFFFVWQVVLILIHNNYEPQYSEEEYYYYQNDT